MEAQALRGGLPVSAALLCLWGSLAAGALPAQTVTTTTDPEGMPVTTTTGVGRGAGAPAPAMGSPTRPIFLSGSVSMDDGSRLPSDVSIQSICGAVRRTMARVSDTGAFAFRWTNSTVAFDDASQTSRTPGGGGTASLTGSRSGSRGEDPLSNCDLVADAPGYSSSRVSLYGRGADFSNAGPIVLHRIGKDEGHTVSVLALHAPKEARKSFEKGARLAAAGKRGEALASFQKAVSLYPSYPDAWLSMGKVLWQLGDAGEARAAFSKAMELDPKLVGTWQELGFLACNDSKWEDAARYLEQAVRLDPMDSPAAWYFDALANFNLGRFEQAERAARAELRLDRGANPQANYVLALALIARNDLEGGAGELRNYIADAPPSASVEAARRELSRVEEKIGKGGGIN